MRLVRQPLHRLVDRLSTKEIAVEELVDALFDEIERRERDVRAYLALADRSELRRAARRQRDKPLRGVPLAIKDNICTRDFPTTCGSRCLAGFRPPYDASVVGALTRAGATVLGKTNLDEFGMGSSTENSAFQVTRNPHDLARVPGGSSGGSAAAVAAGLAPAALGSDTGGSIGQPAALCGVVGLKPSYGRVSRHGLMALGSSLDQIGPLARTVEDAALLLTHLAGPDPRDGTSQGHPPPRDYRVGLCDGMASLRVGLPVQYIEAAERNLSPEAGACVHNWVTRLRALGAHIVDVSLPHAEYGVPALYSILFVEASANLARFDGVRFGNRLEGAAPAASRAAGFGPEVKRRILLGTLLSGSGATEVGYPQALRARRLIQRDFEAAFDAADVLLTPTSPFPAFRLGEKVHSPLEMYLSDYFTMPSRLVGLPSISLPGGTVQGLPFGLQLIGPRFREGTLLRAAWAFERSFRADGGAA